MSRKKVKPIKRRFATRYYSSSHATPEMYVSHGAASTPKGAVRATVVRLFTDRYPLARVYDRQLDSLLFTVRNDGGNLRVHFEDESQIAKLRRVK